MIKPPRPAAHVNKAHLPPNCKPTGSSASARRSEKQQHPPLESIDGAGVKSEALRAVWSYTGTPESSVSPSALELPPHAGNLEPSLPRQSRAQPGRQVEVHAGAGCQVLQLIVLVIVGQDRGRFVEDEGAGEVGCRAGGLAKKWLLERCYCVFRRSTKDCVYPALSRVPRP